MRDPKRPAVYILASTRTGTLYIGVVTRSGATTGVGVSEMASDVSPLV